MNRKEFQSFCVHDLVDRRPKRFVVKSSLGFAEMKAREFLMLQDFSERWRHGAKSEIVTEINRVNRDCRVERVKVFDQLHSHGTHDIENRKVLVIEDQPFWLSPLEINNERLVQRENIIPYYSSPPGRHIVLRGVLGKEDRIIDVWCPWCEAQHRHGWDPGLPPRAIRHLGAHCSSTSSPFTSGLYLIGVSQTRQAPGSTRISPTIQGLKNIPDRLIHGNRLSWYEFIDLACPKDAPNSTPSELKLEEASL